VHVHRAAEHIADVHEDLGPEAAAVAAALTLLSSPTIYSLLRSVAVKSVAALLTIGDVTLNTNGPQGSGVRFRELLRATSLSRAFAAVQERGAVSPASDPFR